MPGPVRYDKKGRVKKTKPRSFGSASKPQPKSPAPVTAAASAVAKATKRAVSRADIPKAARKARKSVLASKEAEKSIQRLRERFSTSVEVGQKQAKREKKLEDTVLRNKLDDGIKSNRYDAFKAGEGLRAATRLNAEGTRVEQLDGLRQLGTQPLGQVQRAAEKNQLKRQGKSFTTPEVRGVQRQVKKAKRQLAKAKRKAMPKITSSSLNTDQERFASVLAKRTGLDPGVVGAWLVAEQGGPPGDEYSAKRYYNFLNIGPFMEHPRFNKSPEDAANFTADSLLGKPGGLSMGASIPGIVPGARGKSPQEQAQVILGSGWGTTQIPLGSAQARPGNTKAVRRAKAKAAKVGERAAELGLRPDGLLNRQQMKQLGIKPPKTQGPNWQLVGGPEDVRSAIEVLGKKVLDQWLPAQGGGTSNYPRNVYNLNPVLARQMVKLAKATGEPILITSGYRSVEDQANISAGVNPKAPPGLSSHQFGMAADAEMSAEQAAMAPRFGLVHGEAGAGVPDPPHTELTDAKLIREALRYGPIRSSYAPAGVPISEGDLGNWKDGGVSGGAAAPSATSSGTVSGGAVSGGGGVSNPAGKKRRQTDVLKLLRQLGYSVTRSGVRRVGGELSTFSEAPESITDLKKRYKVE